jgi:hypothetical protein
MSGSPEVPMSASDTGIRDECHIDKSPLTLSNDEGITGCESGQPSAFGLYHSGIGGGIPDQCRVGQKGACKRSRIQFFISSFSFRLLFLQLPCEAPRLDSMVVIHAIGSGTQTLMPRVMSSHLAWKSLSYSCNF